MAIVKTVFRVYIDDAHELCVVQEDRHDRFLFSLVPTGRPESAVRVRPTITLNKGEARRLGKFLLGIRDLDETPVRQRTAEGLGQPDESDEPPSDDS